MTNSTSQQIIERAVLQLNDLKSIRWTRPELLRWVSDAQRQIAMMVPSVCSQTETMKLVMGTRQKLPEAGWLLLDAHNNITLFGADLYERPGRVVRLISRDLLDRFNPNWHSEKTSATVVNYLYDNQDPYNFWVYPPNNGEGRLQVTYAYVPAELKTETQVLEIPALYDAALTDYVMYRACSKDAEYAPGLALAQGYFTTFSAVVAGKDGAEKANTPRLAAGARGLVQTGANP